MFKNLQKFVKERLDLYAGTTGSTVAVSAAQGPQVKRASLLLLWGISGIYLTFPAAFNVVLEVFLPAVDGFSERADRITAWLSTAHFGRFGGLGIRWTWIVLGLVPAVLFVSGLILWSISVVKPWLKRQSLRRQA